MNTFAERVKEERKQAGLNQQQLAKISGLAQATISDIETGKYEGSRDVVALARALTVRAEWLVTGLGEKQIDAKAHVSEAAPGASNSNLELIERIHARLDHLRWGWADLARAMGLTEQRVNNWRTRGVPARELRNVELALKLPRYALDVATAEIAVNAQGAELGNAKENRLQSLRWVISTRFGGNAGKFADFLEMKRPQMSRWVTDNEASRQGISEESAREIESKLGLRPGSLDSNDTTEKAALGPDESELLGAWAYLLPDEKEAIMEQIRPMAAHNKAVLEHHRKSSAT